MGIATVPGAAKVRPPVHGRSVRVLASGAGVAIFGQPIMGHLKVLSSMLCFGALAPGSFCGQEESDSACISGNLHPAC